MRNRLRDLVDVRRELLEIERGFAQLQQRIDSVRECVTASVTCIFGEESPALGILAEEDFIEKVAGRIAARLGTQPAVPKHIGNRYVREKEAAAFLGVSVQTLRAWRVAADAHVQRPSPPRSSGCVR